MSETLVQKQVRLLLEQECARMFMALVPTACGVEDQRGRVTLGRIGFTLLLVDNLDAGEGGNVAFKTTLVKSELVETFRWWVDRWERGAERQVLTREDLRGRHLIDQLSLQQIADVIKGVLPKGKGFGLLVGSKPAARYIANCDRQGMLATMRDVLLPGWESEQ